MKDRNPNNQEATNTQKIGKIHANKKISVTSDLEIEIDKVHFHLVSNGDSAIIKFNKFSDALSTYRKMRSTSSLNMLEHSPIKELINSTGMTLYLQNKHFALLGPKAGFLIPKTIGLLSLFGRK